VTRDHPQIKKPLEGNRGPSEASLSNLRMALFHGQFLKVRFSLQVNWKTELYEKQVKNRPFQRGCLAPLFT
jgi:hypothetical protein